MRGFKAVREFGGAILFVGACYTSCWKWILLFDWCIFFLWLYGESMWKDWNRGHCAWCLNLIKTQLSQTPLASLVLFWIWKVLLQWCQNKILQYAKKVYPWWTFWELCVCVCVCLRCSVYLLPSITILFRTLWIKRTGLCASITNIVLGWEEWVKYNALMLNNLS